MGYGLQLRVCCWTIGLLWTYCCSAQEAIIVKEDFSTNDRFWYVGSQGYANVTLQKGVYTIDRIQETSGSVFTIENFIDPHQDFSIEGTQQFLEVSVSSHAGLVWNYADINNFDAFIVSNEGTFKIMSVKRGSTTEIAQAHDAIKNKKKKIVLNVQQKGKEYFFFINGKKVFTALSPGLKYAAHGFMLPEKTKCAFTSFTVRQTQQIHLLAEVKAEKHNLGTNINTVFNESAPLISPDGTTLFFFARTTRRTECRHLGVDHNRRRHMGESAFCRKAIEQHRL